MPTSIESKQSAKAKYELVYFDLGGRALETRLAMKIGKIEFKDTRLSFPEFGKAQAAGEFKFGMVPILKVDDEQISESAAILRFIGKLSGLYPEDPIAALKVDEIVDAWENPQAPITFTFLPGKFGVEKEKFDEKEKKRVRKFINDKVLPEFITILEKHLAKNKTKGFCVGSSLTIADLKTFGWVRSIKSGFFDGLDKTLFEKAPSCLAVYKTVLELPEVAEFLKAHPKG